MTFKYSPYLICLFIFKRVVWVFTSCIDPIPGSGEHFRYVAINHENYMAYIDMVEVMVTLVRHIGWYRCPVS